MTYGFYQNIRFRVAKSYFQLIPCIKIKFRSKKTLLHPFCLYKRRQPQLESSINTLEANYLTSIIYIFKEVKKASFFI